MKYRKLDSNGDYSFGHSLADFWVDVPQAPAQAVSTRLNLFQGQWFLDVTRGVPWTTEVAGFNSKTVYDSVIKSQIKNTKSVLGISSYFSSLDASSRLLQVQATIETEFGQVRISQAVTVESGYGVGGYGRRPYGE